MSGRLAGMAPAHATSDQLGDEESSPYPATVIGQFRRHLFVAVAAASLAGCTDSAGEAARTASRASGPTSAEPVVTASVTRPAGQASDERDGIVKAPPTVRLRETDEFGLVVRAERRGGSVGFDVDRLDSLTGEEAERAAAADGTDVSNDHYEVNDNPQTRGYVLAEGAHIWRADPSDVSNPKALTVEQWLAFVASEAGRQAMFHFDVEDGEVIGVEQQYFP